MTLNLDHLVWGTPDLDKGCAAIERLFGVAPALGGSHPGIGTCNALLSLGPNLYLEIMAPDNPPAGSIGERLAELDEPGLITWVLRATDLSNVEHRAKQANNEVTPLGPVPTQRLTPEGERLEWALLFLTQHDHNGLVPFFIDWQQTKHPSVSAPNGSHLLEIELASTRATQLNPLLTRIGVPHLALSGTQDILTARFQTKAGQVTLQSTPHSLKVMNMWEPAKD